MPIEIKSVEDGIRYAFYELHKFNKPEEKKDYRYSIDQIQSKKSLKNYNNAEILAAFTRVRVFGLNGYFSINSAELSEIGRRFDSEYELKGRVIYIFS